MRAIARRMFRFEDLPEELKVKILEYFFEGSEDSEYANTHHSGGCQPVREYTIYLPSPCSDCSASLRMTDLHLKRCQHITGNVHLHPSFPALFTSKSFLKFALPVYARSTSLKISSILQLHQIRKPSRQNILNESILKILARAKTLTIPTDQHLLASRCTPVFRKALPALDTVVFQDSNIHVWSRLPICMLYNDTHPRPRVFQDVFQTKAIAHICPENTHMVISDAQLQALKSEEKTFPGNLTLLCQYIGSVAPCDYPRQIHRVVTIECYADLSLCEEPGRLSGDLTKRKILMVRFSSLRTGREFCCLWQS